MIGKGPVLVLASQVVAVIIHGLAKFLETTGSVEPQQILQVRMFITLSINCLLLTSRSPNELPLGTKNIRGLLALRTIGGICGSTGFYCLSPFKPLSRSWKYRRTCNLADFGLHVRFFGVPPSGRCNNFESPRTFGSQLSHQQEIQPITVCLCGYLFPRCWTYRKTTFCCESALQHCWR